jgi:hypothetical protein
MISKEEGRLINKLKEQQQTTKAEGRQDQAQRATRTENISF